MKKIILGILAIIQILLGIIILARLDSNSAFADIIFDTHVANTWLGDPYREARATQVEGTLPVETPIQVITIPNTDSH